MMSKVKSVSAVFATFGLLAALSGGAIAGRRDSSEANKLLASAAVESGLNATQYRQKILAKQFPKSWHIFFSSTLNIDFTTQVVTLPLYEGSSPKGKEYYIITEASDFETDKRLGINYAPKLIHVVPTGAAQKATFDENKRLVFEGSVDFSPVRSLGVSKITSSAAALKEVDAPVPGAVGDSKYSPLVQLPSGIVLNITYVRNASGKHPHTVDSAAGFDRTIKAVSLGFLDGYQGGKRYYYHLVTDANDQGPAAIEGGTYAPRLALLKTFGHDLPSDDSALLAFSPVGNGKPQGDAQQQGLNTLIFNYKKELADGKSPNFKPDPINVFPLQPDNNLAGKSNNYSPLWDAHISAWVEPASATRITGIAQLKKLIAGGHVVSFGAGTAVGDLVPLVPNGLIINCPVLAQPDESVVESLKSRS